MARPLTTRTTDGYQQVELTSELLHRQSGSTQQVISTVPCTKHLPFFLSIILADVFLFGSVILFVVHTHHFGDGFSIEKQIEAPYRQFNLHALIMLIAMIYFNGQAITAYKSNYMVKHKSVSMLYQFLLHLLTICGIVGGVYFSYNAQEAVQYNRTSVSHFYSVHSWTALITIALFTIQFLTGFCSFFVSLCFRKFTARMRNRAIPLHRMLTMIVLCLSVATAISGLNQLARFELNGLKGKDNYHDFNAPTLLINFTAVSIILSMILIFLITSMFKRRQAHDLPVLFKIILLVTQFIEIILILVVAEYIFPVVTPHVNKVISGELLANTTIHYFYNNATNSINTFVSTARDHINSVIGLSSNNQTDSSVSPVANLTSL